MDRARLSSRGGFQERARASGFATAEVQVSETETPLHRWEAVYRRLVERLATSDTPDGALRASVDAWFYTLEEDVIAEGQALPPMPQRWRLRRRRLWRSVCRKSLGQLLPSQPFFERTGGH